MHGVLLVDKPEGITSAGVIRVLKPWVGSHKVGHLGTLDPFATGLLPLCVGEATKVAQFLSCEDKAYVGRIRLGVETDTMDRTGQVVATSRVPELSDSMLGNTAERFVGEQWQIPPMFSAVKRDGVPLYRLARKGIEVDRAPRRVHVRALTLALEGSDEVAFSVECSKGTYVRVLASAIGETLGCGGHLSALRRVRFGAFDVREARTLAQLEARAADESLPVVPIRKALMHLRELTVPPQAASVLRRGQQGLLARLPAPNRPTEAAKIVSTDGEMVAMVEADPRRGRWRLARTLEIKASRTRAAGAKLYKPQTAC